MDKQNPTLGDENPILTFLRMKLISQNAPIAADQNDVNAALGIDQSPPKIDTSDGQFMGELTADTKSVPMPVPNLAFGGDVSSSAIQMALNTLGIPSPTQTQDMSGDSPTEVPTDYMQGAAEKAAAPVTPQPWMQSPSSAQVAQLPQQAAPSQQSQMPNLSMAAQNATNMPSTQYDLNKGISAEDRAALYKQLLARQSSPGQLAVSGAAGLGDAIARSFGHQNTDYQKIVGENLNKNTDAQISGMDTQRQQRLQDMQTHTEMQMNDPNSSIAQSMRATLKSAGLNVPSGMSPALMLKVAGPLGELAMKQATLAETAMYHRGELGNAAANREEKKATYASEHPILNWMNPVDGQQPSSPVSNPNAPGHTIGQAMTHPSGAKITRIS